MSRKIYRESDRVRIHSSSLSPTTFLGTSTFFVLETVLRFSKKVLMSFDEEALVVSLFFRFFDYLPFKLLVFIVSMPALFSTKDPAIFVSSC